MRESEIWTTRSHTLFFTDNEKALLLFSYPMPFSNYSLFLPANDSIRVSETSKQTNKTPNAWSRDNRDVFSRGDLGMDVGVESTSGENGSSSSPAWGQLVPKLAARRSKAHLFSFGRIMA